MFSATLDYQGFEALQQALGELEVRASDLRPLAEELRDVMVEDNVRRALAGVDLNDVDLAALQPETIRRRKGTGPPLVPQGGAAELVQGYQVEIHEVLPHQLNVVGHWPAMPFLRYHVTGYTARSGAFVPARNPAGITPRGGDLVIDRFEAFVAGVIAPLGVV